MFRCAGRPQGEEERDKFKVVQSNIGGLISVQSWNTTVTQIVWVAKWSKKGLMPVAPRVLLARGACIEVGQALVIA